MMYPRIISTYTYFFSFELETIFDYVIDTIDPN